MHCLRALPNVPDRRPGVPVRGTAGLVLVVLAACSPDERGAFDATVTFSLATGSRTTTTTTQGATVFLAVQKPGRRDIVNAGPDDVGEGARYGRHEFPPYCTTASIAAYFGPVLANAGWKKTDYEVEGASLHFHGVTRLDGGANGNEIRVTVKKTRRR